MKPTNEVSAGEGPYKPGDSKREFHRKGQNVGNQADPMSCDGMAIASATNTPAMRLVLYRGRDPMAHLSLTIEGMEQLIMDLVTCVDEAKKQHGKASDVN